MKRGKHRPVLKPEEKVEIPNAVLVLFEKQKEVAKQYRVSPSTFCQIVAKTKKNKHSLKRSSTSRC